MSEQAITREKEVSSLERMQQLITHGENNLKQPQVAPRISIVFYRHFYREMAKIYGRDFLPPPNLPFSTLTSEQKRSLTQDQIRTSLRNQIASAKRIVELLEPIPFRLSGNRVFIGHGRSLIWRELKDFIADRLNLPWDEFNREAVAGYATSERLRTMLDQASFAFLIMTAEDEHADESLHARPNVIHEIGLFQGRLGMHRAIILLEDGCSEFSNIVGLSQIRFPRGCISACFEEIRRVLEREGNI